MDMMDFISTLARLDDGSELFDRATMFVMDRNTKSYLSFVNLLREDYMTISGSILSCITNFTLDQFTTDITSGRHVHIRAYGEMDFTGRWLHIAKQFSKIVERTGKHVNLILCTKNDERTIENISHKSIVTEVSEFFVDKGNVEDYPLKSIKISITNQDNYIAITLKEEF